MPHDVFISYSSKDKTTADAACAFLESKGIRCWIAPRDVLPGTEWGASVANAISASKVLLLVFSKNSNASPQIVREVERAVSRGLPVLPMRIEDVKPTDSLEYFISTPHWLDAFTPPLQKHLEYLSSVIAQLLGMPAPEHGVIAAPVAEPRRGTRRMAIVSAVCVGVIALGALAWFLLRQNPFGGEAAFAPQCLVKVASMPSAPVCGQLMEANAEWQDCSSRFANGDMGARERDAQKLVDSGQPASSFYYDSNFAAGAYGPISHYWEVFAQCVNEKYLPFDSVASGISFPEHFWNRTRKLRQIFLKNWNGPNQPLPDFMSNFHGMCVLYNQRRAQGRGGGDIDCTL